MYMWEYMYTYPSSSFLLFCQKSDVEIDWRYIYNIYIYIKWASLYLVITPGDKQFFMVRIHNGFILLLVLEEI